MFSLNALYDRNGGDHISQTIIRLTLDIFFQKLIHKMSSEDEDSFQCQQLKDYFEKTGELASISNYLKDSGVSEN